MCVPFSAIGASMIDVHTHTNTEMSTSCKTVTVFIYFSKPVICLDLKHNDKNEVHRAPYA